MIVRIALANIEIPSSPADSVERVLRALPEAAKAGARVVCFPEAYVPGYPWGERRPANVDAKFLDDAHANRTVSSQAFVCDIPVEEASGLLARRLRD